MTLKKSILFIFAITYCCLAVGFVLRWNSLFIYRLIGTVYLLLSVYMIQRYILQLPGIMSIYLSPLAVSLPIMIFGSFAYYLFGITQWVILLLLSLPLCLLVFIPGESLSELKTVFTQPRIYIPQILLFISFLATIGVIIVALLRHATTLSLLGPWSVLPHYVLALFFVASLILIALILLKLPNPITLFCISILFFTAFFIGFAVFPLGLGFDPILHQATEKLIQLQGFVNPKTFYYIGQYVFVVFLSSLFSWDIVTVDRLLMPILAATALPILSFATLKYYFKTADTWALLGSLLLLLFPFSYGISTTPWALAFLMSICISLLSVCFFEHKSKASMFLIGCLTLATLTIHPLAGLPVLGYFLLVLIGRIERRLSLKRVLTTVCFLFFATSIPLALYINANVSSQLQLSIHLPSLTFFKDILGIFSLHTSTRFNMLIDFVYFFQKNLPLLLLLCSIAGIVLAIKNGLPKKKIHLSLLGFFVCIVNAILIDQCFTFTSLISYEQRDYATRIMWLGVVLLIPVILYSFAQLSLRIFNASGRFILKTASVMALAALLTSSLYTSYPRNDAFASYHGYTISSADIASVRYINENSSSEQFIVLSNQVVASAAVKEYGFKKYFSVQWGEKQEELFYYPIPTSSPFYTIYREMLNSPSRETIKKINKIVNVPHVYFVVNAYEDRFQNIIDKAKISSSSWIEIEGGKNYVFRYDL